MFSILVVDYYKNGIPEAFCLSNKSSENLFKIYFAVIKNAVHKIDTKTFTTYSYCFLNACSPVVGTVENVLCAWRVTRNWCQHLNKIKNAKNRKLVFKTLKAVRRYIS